LLADARSIAVQMFSFRQRCARSVAAGSMTLLCGCIAAAQSTPETTLKAGYLYNFAKFTEWRRTGQTRSTS
jgi:hypothetical protein